MNVLGDIYLKFYQYLLPFINQMPFEYTFIIGDQSLSYERNNKCQESVADDHTRYPNNHSQITHSLTVRYLYSWISETIETSEP